MRWLTIILQTPQPRKTWPDTTTFFQHFHTDKWMELYVWKCCYFLAHYILYIYCNACDCEHQLVFPWEAGQFFVRSLENWMQIKATRFAPVREENCRVGLITWDCGVRGNGWGERGQSEPRALKARRFLIQYRQINLLAAESGAAASIQSLPPEEIYSERKIALSAATVISVNGAALSDWRSECLSLRCIRPVRRLIAPMSVTFALLIATALSRFHLVLQANIMRKFYSNSWFH